MKKFILMIAIALSAITMNGQATAPEYKVVGDKIVKIKSSKNKVEPVDSGLTYTDSKGVVYPVMKSARGAYFIVRTSKKSGKKYKKYLKI